jgi:serine/threonine-protein kinase
MSDPLAQLQSALADRYTFGPELGNGAAARVFAGEDLRHRRPVAIKVLRPELCEAWASERFLREIATSAKLRHPHILPLFDSGDADGQLYFVMPLIAGETLRARLQREGQLPVDEAVRLAQEVSGALAHAHEHGVVHRDVKPENILLDSGHAVVADFGIARPVQLDGASITRGGLRVGTPRYMSPEQLSDDGPLDGRSDQYSLACTLFEMLTGRAPFDGDTLQRLTFQHLMEPPPSVLQFRPAVSSAVALAISKAMAKTPDERFASMGEFSAALSGAITVAPERRSVAVLPFRSLSAESDSEYFAEGVTEDVVAQLSKVRALKVVARSAVLQLTKGGGDLRVLAARLGVGAILEGSVRRAGTRVRIVAQLMDAVRQQPLWSETFDEDVSDIFAVQSAVALRIAAALRAELTADESARIVRAPTSDIRAYQLLLRGRQQFVQFTGDGMRAALALYERAAALDPDYAPAWAAIGLTLVEMGQTGELSPQEAYPRAREAADRAVALDDQLADAHVARAYGLMVYDYDWAGAEGALQRALRLNPSSADAYALYGRLCNAMGRFDEAVTLVLRGQELDPLAVRVDVATAYLRAGRNEEGLAEARRVIELDPEHTRGLATCGWALMRTGATAEGVAALERASATQPDNPVWLAQLGEAYGLAGRRAEAEAILARLEARARTEYVAPYHLAYLHTGLGNFDAAMDRLEESFAERAGAVYAVRGSFLFETLREQPRFKELLERMKLP